jgi:iron complex outermembrane receptor protein
MPGCNSTSYNAGQCTYKDTWSQVQPNTANFNAVSRLTLNLANDWQASFEGTFFQSKAQQVGAPSASQDAGYQGITSGPGVTPTLLAAIQNTISSTNPSFPAGAGFTSGPLTYSFLNELGPTVTDTDAKTTRLVADVTGSYFGWDLQGAGGYTQVQLQVLGRGYVNPYNLQSALDSTTDPFLVGQKNSSSMDSFIAPTLVANDTSKLEFIHLGGSHDLMPLKGGELSVAVGYDFVHRVQNALAPSGVADGTTPNFSNNFTVGYQTVNSAFAEVDAPVLKSLDIDGAVRYDHYNLSGGKASPKVGFKWTPVEQFALRGTVAKGFRAPGPAENGTAGQTFFTGNSPDPDLCKHRSYDRQPTGRFVPHAMFGRGRHAAVHQREAQARNFEVLHARRDPRADQELQRVD